MAENKVLVQYGHVASIDDPLDGMRIRVRLNQDRVDDSELPYAFPLLPKTIQSMPTVGEGVFVFTMELGNNHSQRFYLGPIISQPQFFEHDKYSILGGDKYQQAASLLQGAGNSAPHGGISQYPETHGAFPDKKSVAMIGRSSEDIEIKNGEIDIRCGIRGETRSASERYAVDAKKSDSLFGKVVFNGLDPAYIQLKYNNSGVVWGGNNETRSNSVINMVAGKINLVSTNDTAYSDAIIDDNNQRTLIVEKKMGELMESLHEVPWGDKLIEYLDLFRTQFALHTHPFPMLPPSENFSEDLLSKNLKDLLSKDVRIS